MSRPSRHNSEHMVGNDAEETPEAYLEAIVQYAARSQSDHFHCGQHYQDLARFLRTTQIEDSTDFAFITCHFFEQDQVYPPVECKTSNEFLDSRQLKPNCAQLIFLRGYPSAESLKVLGAKFRIDPEYFRQHIYLQNPAQPFYDLPPLPSGSRNILRLKVATIVNRGSTITHRQVEEQRVESVSLVMKHQVSLAMRNAVGESVVRKFSVHSERYFTIEQYITCCMVRKNGGWAALIWLDSGQDLPSLGPDPWCSNQLRQNSYIPIIQHIPKLALRVADEAQEPQSGPQATAYTPSGSSKQSSKLLPRQYGSGLKPQLARSDPIYSLSEVFEYAACSESQFINFMRANIEESLRDSEKAQPLSLTNLRYSKDLLDEHVAYLSDVTTFFENDLDAWRLTGSSTQQDDKVQRDLLRDYKCLLTRAENLAKRCLDGTQIIMNSAMLKESRKGIVQAEEVTRLTTLVMFFAPASFVCSIFSMSFVKFSRDDVAIAVFVCTFVVFVGAPAYLFVKSRFADGKIR